MRFQMLANAFLMLLFLSIANLGINFTFVSAQSEKQLLIEFRNNLTFDSSVSTKLNQWNKSSDFCQWPGVKCDAKKRVSALDLSNESISGGINDASNSLFKLVHLQSLNLAGNSFGQSLPSGFGQLTELRYLNLSNSGFSGQVPSDFSNLTRLVVLDLSNTVYTALELGNPNLRKLIRNFVELRELYLDGVNISANGNEWSSAVSSSLPNLRVLSLRDSYITGPFDSSLLKLKSLSVIRLDGNAFSSALPDFFADFSNLSVFTLSACGLTSVPAKLFQIKSLQIIDLGNNRDLKGSLPEFPVNGSLQSLVLSYTKFSGNVPESIGNLRMLSNVDLRSCSFSGPVPKSIKSLNHLVYLDLSLNQFSGSVPSFALLKNLRVINLRSNRLRGQIPDSNWKGLDNLNFLDLSENLLQGEIPASLFGLPSLKFLSCSNNSFSGSIRVSTSTSSTLETLELSLNNLEGPIPRFLFELKNLSTLSLAWNKFNGSVDLTDFRKLKDLVSFDLSFNNLSIHVDEKVAISSLFPRLGSLRLASCKLQKIPLLKNQSSLMMLDLSVNQLKGEIPNWIWIVGNGFLRYVNLSHNGFTHLQEPYDLRSLQYIDLHSNSLGGKIPLPPFAAFIDFSSNKFSSSLPPNIGNYFKNAISISIAYNKITGTIPFSLCNTTRLQILDFSNNGFSGGIPSCLLEKTLRTLNLRRNKFDGQIPDTFPVGCPLETLDLSRNVLRGKVPKTLERCTELVVLNFSHNALSGHIPSSIGNLLKLESLDVSFNDLDGKIPSQLASLTFLSFLNVSYNHLVGRIPQGGKLQTFPKSCFIGNDGLCGLPLNKTCNGTRTWPAFPHMKLE
ncbi:hypothetical protein ACS0TY_015715 [Phlomoides rotata]